MHCRAIKIILKMNCKITVNDCTKTKSIIKNSISNLWNNVSYREYCIYNEGIIYYFVEFLNRTSFSVRRKALMLGFADLDKIPNYIEHSIQVIKKDHIKDDCAFYLNEGGKFYSEKLENLNLTV